MSNKVQIRALDEKDLDAVVKIDKNVLGKERQDFWKRKIGFAGIHPRPQLVAEVEGKVVGFILGYVSGWELGVPDTVGWIDILGVDPAYQHQGIGTALFKALIESFKRSGREEQPEAMEPAKRKIEGVNVVHTLVGWNDWDLIQFYHAMGFKRGDMINLELNIRK